MAQGSPRTRGASFFDDLLAAALGGLITLGLVSADGCEEGEPPEAEDGIGLPNHRGPPLTLKGGQPYKRAYGEPEDKAQSHFTDPDSAPRRGLPAVLQRAGGGGR